MTGMQLRFWIAGVVLVLVLSLGVLLPLILASIALYAYGAFRLIRSGHQVGWALVVVPLASLIIALLPIHHRYDTYRLLGIIVLWFASMTPVLIWALISRERWGFVSLLPIVFVPVIMLIFTGTMA